MIAAIRTIVELLGGLRATVFALALVVTAAYAIGLRHALTTARAAVATAQAERDAALNGADLCAAANDTSAASVARLRLAVAECEAGRLADTAATQAALRARDTARAAIERDAAAARAALARANAGRCKTWAGQPACGVTP